MFAAERKGECIKWIDFDNTVLTALGLSIKYILYIVSIWQLYTAVTPTAAGHLWYTFI